MAIYEESVIDVLNLTDSADSNIKPETVTDALALSDAIDHNILIESITDNVGITDQIRQIYINVSDSVTFSDTDISSIKPLSPSDSLNLTDSLDLGSPIYLSATDYLKTPLASYVEEFGTDELDEFIGFGDYDFGLVDSVSVELILTISVNDIIEFIDQANTAIPISITDVLPLFESALNITLGEALDVIVFSETVSADIFNPASDTLTITEVIDVDGDYPRSASDTINFQDVVSYTLTNLCEYGLGVGFGSFDYEAPSATPPTLVRTSQVTFTYPYISPTLTLDLRNPNLDNVTQLEQRRINRRSRGGTLQVFRDTAWPASERLILTFSALKESERHSLFNFLDMSLGKEIGYLDHESRQWRGVILTPSTQTSQSGKGCSFTASIEFEGVKV